MSILPGAKIRVGVLRGGPSSEYASSLETGKRVISILRDMSDAYEPVDIFIDKHGAWHYQGVRHAPYKALAHTDVVWNALHGDFGEDGQIQQVLSYHHIPYTGPTSVAAALSLNKDLTKRAYETHSILTPKHELLLEEDASVDHLIHIFRTYLHPVIVKPSDGSGWQEVRMAHTFGELQEAIQAAFKHSRKVLIEEYIRGREASCGVVENVRGETLYAFMPVEVRAKSHSFGPDFPSKQKEREHLSPGNFTSFEHKRIEAITRRAHEILGLRHYSHSDFIVTPKGRVYILETNALPKLGESSPFTASFGAVGWQEKDFVDHVLKLALLKGSHN